MSNAYQCARCGEVREGVPAGNGIIVQGLAGYQLEAYIYPDDGLPGVPLNGDGQPEGFPDVCPACVADLLRRAADGVDVGRFEPVVERVEHDWGEDEDGPGGEPEDEGDAITIRCGCGQEELRFEVDRDLGITAAMWHRVRESSLAQRLRWCWELLREGFPYGNGWLFISPQDARRLAAWLVRAAAR